MSDFEFYIHTCINYQELANFLTVSSSLPHDGQMKQT